MNDDRKDEDGFLVFGGTKRTRLGEFNIPNPVGEPTRFLCFEADTEDPNTPVLRWVSIQIRSRLADMVVISAEDFRKFRKAETDHLAEVQRRIEAWEQRAVHPGMDGKLAPQLTVSSSLCEVNIQWWLLDGQLWMRPESCYVRLRLPWSHGFPGVHFGTEAWVDGEKACRPLSSSGLGSSYGYWEKDLPMLAKCKDLKPAARDVCRHIASILVDWDPKRRNVPTTEALRAWKDIPQ